MDPSAQQTQTDQPIHRAQPPVTAPRPGQSVDTSVAASNISVGKESEPATMTQNAETIQVTSQETHVSQPTVEVQSVNNEPQIDASVEHVVEKSPDQEKPVLSEAVQQAGVTHSGPGAIQDTIIKVKENKFGVKELEVSFPDAVRTEKKTPFKSSKHWLMGVYEYVWRKINPNLRKEQIKN